MNLLKKYFAGGLSFFHNFFAFIKSLFIIFWHFTLIDKLANRSLIIKYQRAFMILFWKSTVILILQL